MKMNLVVIATIDHNVLKPFPSALFQNIVNLLNETGLSQCGKILGGSFQSYMFILI